MRNRSYKNVGKRIGRAVRDAMRTGRYEGIGQAVGNEIKDFTNYGNEVLDDLKNAARRPPYPDNSIFRDGTGGGWKASSAEPRQAGQVPSGGIAFRKRMPGSVLGMVYTIIGLALGIPLLIADMVIFIVGLVQNTLFSYFVIPFSILSPLLIVFLSLMSYGIALRRRARRFARYRDAMGSAVFCTVAKLADLTGETQARTKKDLKKMIASDACPQGHLDRDEACFMVNDETYYDYLDAEKAYAARTEAERTEEQVKQTDPKEAELAAVIKEGGGYLQQIRAVNDALPGEVISEKLNRLENVAARIFICIRQHPEKLPDIRRFIRYYMPTTLKLVKSYEEFEKQPMQGENITKAKEEIERALDTINAAFENLLDTLFADDALDVSTDISTLETMFKQEGLTGSDFAKVPGNDKPL